ncbi:MAG: WD40 repeat domain-containing protein [Hyalangium sp.]|uniref:WD40 repeat domain-containing protein n=1 Tax=Hyalangium sp. TaxID=2028555 RepID=UPI0038999AFD
MQPRDGDALPDGARLRLGTTRFRPGLGPLAPVFSPEGERMLVEDSESTPQLHILEARTGRRLETLRKLSGELGRVLALSWTAEGIRVACQLYGGRPAVLEYAHSRVRQLESQDAPWADSAAFSADGERVAMVDHQGAVRVWNTGTGQMLARARPLTGTVGGPGVHKAVAMSSDGQRVAWSTGDTRIHLYDVASRQLRPALLAHSETVAELAFSPDGTRLASAALSDEPRIRIWDVERWEAALDLPALGAYFEQGEHGTPCPSFAFIGPGARLAWLDGDALRTQDLATGASTSLPVGTVQSYASLSASPDGAYVVAREGHALRTWSLDTGQPDPARDSHWQPVRTVAVSPEGMLAATSDDQSSVRIWHLAWGQCLGQLELSAARGCLRFSPDGRWLAVGTSQGQVHLWSCGEGRVLHSFPTHTSRIEALVFSPDSLWLATCSDQGGDVSVWAVPSGKRRRVLESGSERLTALDYSPDSQWLAVGGMDGTIFFFSAPDGRLAHRVRAPDASVHRVRFFPDGQRLLSVGLLDSDSPDDGPGQPMLQIWHADTGRLLASRRARSHQLELSPDGRQLLYVPWRNPALCVEDAMTGEDPRTLLLVPEVECQDYSQGPSVWVTGHRDCTALVWELSPSLLGPRPG